MRVTNGMIRNNTINNLYKNIAAVNQSYAQMSTGKKIQTVSDDPIIAGRAIKLKGNVLEIQQYQKNAKEARSWMEITETSMDNMTKILQEIRTKCVQASTGTLEEKDKAVIKTDIMQLWKQLQEEANVTYGGRYVYSGYKTSEPLILNKDTTLKDNCNLKGELRVVKSAQIKAGTKLAAGSTLVKGTEISTEDAIKLGLNPDTAKETYKLEADITVNVAAGITLEKDATVAEGSVLKANSEQEISTIMSLENNITTKAGTVLSAGTELKKGSGLELGTVLSGDDARALGLISDPKVTSYELTTRVVLDQDITFKNTVSTGEKSSLLVGSKIAPGSVVIGAFTQQVEEGAVIGEDTKLAADSILLVGSELGSGTVLKSGTVLSANDAKALGLTEDTSEADFTLEEDLILNSPYKLKGLAKPKEGSILSNETTLATGSSINIAFEEQVPTGIVLDGDKLILGGTNLNADSKLLAGTILKSGTVLTGEDARALGLTTDTKLSKYTLTADKTLSTDTTFTGPIALGEGSRIKGGSEVTHGSNIKVESELAAGTTLSKGTLNPLVHGKIEGHDMNYEIGTGNNINANTLEMDGTFNNLLASMQEIMLTVDQSLEEDSKITNEDLYALFNDKIGEIDGILTDVSTKSADLGSRMARLDYIEERLIDNSADYKELLSNTEDIDVEEVYVEFNSRYAAYTAALQATSKVIMNTLADYL